MGKRTRRGLGSGPGLGSGLLLGSERLCAGVGLWLPAAAMKRDVRILLLGEGRHPGRGRGSGPVLPGTGAPRPWLPC